MTRFPPAHLIVAIDFGRASGRAAALAGALANAFRARLTAVHAEAVDVPPYFTREQIDALERQLQAARRTAETEIRAFIARYTRVPADVVVVEGPAAEGVLSAAANADLIVVGTHGRRGPSRWWLGSVAERVVRAASAPVLVVPESGEADAEPVSGGGALLLSEQADRGVREWADALGTIFEMPVHAWRSLDKCTPADVAAAGIVIVTMDPEPSRRAVHATMGTLTRGCRAPVLFVPDARRDEGATGETSPHPVAPDRGR